MATIDDVLAHEDDTAFAIALSKLVCPRANEEGFDSLTPAERVAYCVDALEGEVNNGGFDQFFFNSAGDTALETLVALDAIGAPAARSIVERAIAALPGGVAPKDRSERQDRLLAAGEAVRARLQALDQEFYAYPDPIERLLRAFVEKHRSDFRPR